LDIERQLTLYLVWHKDTVIVGKLKRIIESNEEEEKKEASGEGATAERSLILGAKGESMAEVFARNSASEKAQEKALYSLR